MFFLVARVLYTVNTSICSNLESNQDNMYQVSQEMYFTFLNARNRSSKSSLEIEATSEIFSELCLLISKTHSI